MCLCLICSTNKNLLKKKGIIMKTIYETKGAAKEYCDLAVDIYEYCPHKCKYCYEKAKVERKKRISYLQPSLRRSAPPS